MFFYLRLLWNSVIFNIYGTKNDNVIKSIDIYISIFILLSEDDKVLYVPDKQLKQTIETKKDTPKIFMKSPKN